MILFKIIKKNKIDSLKLLALILIYNIPLLSIITWGIPNINHPFTYHMDEWHQLQAVKAVFKQFSNNIPGAAHGPMFHFLLTGIYLSPFYLLHIINPFILKSSLDALSMQEMIFIVLRLNTLLFGTSSLIVLYILAKKYLKINPFLTCLLFLITPIWLMLSNYFKYDIALIFWILASLLCLFRYRDAPTLKNFLLSAAVCALAVATKISALPLIPVYFIAFLLFTPKPLKNFKRLLLGAVVFSSVFCLVGIPDLLLQKGDYKEFLYSNLISGPETTQNFQINSPELIYLFLHQYPVLFGHGFFLLIMGSIGFCIVLLCKKLLKKISTKTEIFLFSSSALFLLSLLPLKLTATGNRSLVMLPFLVLLSAMAIKKIHEKFSRYSLLINISIVIIISLQILECSGWFLLKISPDPRQVSSAWIANHIPKGSVIGLENIPIYQMIPDILLKDYYTQTIYKYKIVDASISQLPKYIIITNGDYEKKYLKHSPKKDLLSQMKKMGYKRVAYFSSNRTGYYLFNNELDYNLSNLVPAAPIEIYENKHKM